MTHEPPFPMNAGDSVNYVGSHGFQTGYFVRWNKNGAAVIKKPAGGHVSLAPSLLRPCNDGRMVKKRGIIEMPGYNVIAHSKPKRKK